VRCACGLSWACSEEGTWSERRERVPVPASPLPRSRTESQVGGSVTSTSATFTCGGRKAREQAANSNQASSKQQAASSKQQAASSKQAATNLGGPRWCNWQAGGKRRQKERAQSYALLLIVTPWSAPKYSHHRVLNCEARWETETANGASILTQALVARAMPSPKTLAARMGPSSATFARQARGQSMQNETKTNCDDKRMR